MTAYDPTTDTNASFPSPFTPTIAPDTWQVQVIEAPDLNSIRTVFSVGHQHFTLASGECEEEDRVHCEFIRECFIEALSRIGLRHVPYGPTDNDPPIDTGC